MKRIEQISKIKTVLQKITTEKEDESSKMTDMVAVEACFSTNSIKEEGK